MADYIKREDVLRITRPDDWGTPDERWKPESEFGKFVENLPAVDVVEVVRCKDCKFYRADQDGVWLCNCPELPIFDPNEKFFCGHAVRREEADDELQ